MEWLTNPEIWVAFFTLTALEIVLGIDNIIMISILVSRMPKHMQQRTRIFGLGLAMITRILLLLSITLIGFWATESVLHRTLPYDPVRSFVPVVTAVLVALAWRPLLISSGPLFPFAAPAASVLARDAMVSAYNSFSPNGEWLALGGRRKAQVLRRDGRGPRWRPTCRDPTK